jgi:hypothetical protein
MQQEGANYFTNQSKEDNKEENPIIVEPESAIKYFNLEKVFNTFFPERSLSIAKEKSTEERDSKHINDSSFTYGEVVIKIYILYIIIKFSLDF